VNAGARDVLSPREIADRAGFSYHAILRAIHRGDLRAFEPVPGRYRVEMVEYERWLRTPARRVPEPSSTQNPSPRRRTRASDADRGSFARSAIEGGA
jgi:hypothetical protein